MGSCQSDVTVDNKAQTSLARVIDDPILSDHEGGTTSPVVAIEATKPIINSELPDYMIREYSAKDEDILQWLVKLKNDPMSK